MPRCLLFSSTTRRRLFTCSNAPGSRANNSAWPSASAIDHGPSDADIERFSDVTQTCPSCGTTLYDDVEVCWNCGHALGAERKIEIPLWMWITAAGLLALAIIGMLVRW